MHPTLTAYRDLLAEATRTLNLTAVRDPAEIDRRHIAESVAVVRALEGAGLLPDAARVIDVGSGGGLPGIPLAIVRPDVSVTLLEATGKKAAFLERAAATLGLSNVRVISTRAEQSAHAPGERGSYHLAAARAVAPLDALVELTLPFVQVGGAVAAVKGSRAEKELLAASVAIARLGGGTPYLLTLEVEEPHLRLVIIPKLTPTPFAYPRRAGVPAKRPLR